LSFVVVDEDINPPEERHLVVPLATELFLYYAFFSNEMEKPIWLTRRSTLRKKDIMSFILVDEDINPPEERHFVVPLATEQFLYYAFFSNEKSILPWLMRTSTLRKKDILSFIMVDQEVNPPEE